MSHINTPGVLAEIVQRTGVDMKREQSRAWMLMAALVLLAALIGGKEFWRKQAGVTGVYRKNVHARGGLSESG